MIFTSRGLIEKDCSNIMCRTWDDLYEINGRDTIDKKKKFKAKYKDHIKQVECYGNNRIRNNKYMVASIELARNEFESDIQNKAFNGKNIEIKTKKERAIRKSKNNMIFYMAVKELGEIVDYHFKSIIIGGDIVNKNTGEILISGEWINYTIEEILKSQNKKNYDELILNLIIDMYNKIGIKIKCSALNNKEDGTCLVSFK